MSNRPRTNLNKLEHGLLLGFQSHLIRELGDVGLSEDEIRMLMDDRELLAPSVACMVEYMRKMAPAIDCDAMPTSVFGRSVSEHSKRGTIRWCKAHQGVRLFPEMVGKATFRSIRSRLAGIAHGANVLDFLICSPSLIPDWWKRYSFIVFLDTVYGGDYVRALMMERLFEPEKCCLISLDETYPDTEYAIAASFV